MYDLKLKSPDPVIISRLLNLTHPSNVADLLEIDYKDLRYYLYRKGVSANYSIFEISKKSGGQRKIQAPLGGMKILQKKLNYVLNLVYKPRNFVFGFRRGKGIKDNAELHLGQRFIFTIDIKDFFTAIHFGRVRGLFMGKKFGFNWEVASTLAHICCYRESPDNAFLPQGAPTSPIISNMICYDLDRSLTILANKNKCYYSRYADDITFSSNRYFSEAILKRQVDYRDKNLYLGDELEEIFNKHKFELNYNKTRLRGKGEQQNITGLVINKKVNVDRKFIKHVRAILYDWENRGYDDARKKFFDGYDKHKFSGNNDLKSIVEGKINFIGHIKGFNNYVYAKLFNRYNRLVNNGKPILPESRFEKISRCLWLVKTENGWEGTAFSLKNYGIVTCRHVVNGRKRIQIARYNDTGTLLNVSIEKSSEDKDLAILNFIVKKDYPSLEVSSVTMNKDQNLSVFGFPSYNLGNEPSETKGMTISLKNTTPARYTFNTPLFQGNSGGPALDSDDRVVGVAAYGFGEGTPTDIGIVPIEGIDSI